MHHEFLHIRRIIVTNRLLMGVVEKDKGMTEVTVKMHDS